MIRTRCITILLLLAGCLSSALPVEPSSLSSQAPRGLSLKLSVESASLRVMEQPKVKITISNQGRDPVVLVRPGDGSDREMRSPLTKWLVEPLPGEGDPKGILQVIMDCGNINALRPDEIFTIAPGETETFRTNVWAVFSKPGKYRVRYVYENRPSMEWKGIVLGQHDEEAMRRVRESTSCKLISNEVVFIVSEGEKPPPDNSFGRMRN